MSPRYTALFALLFVAACASPPAPTDGAPDTSVTDTAASDAAPNTDADVDADIDVDADNADAEDDDIDANDGLPNAAPCVEDAECASELCLDLQHHDAFCAQYCVADECTDGQSCQVYTPSAGSQPFGVCLEITACFDADGDGFGGTDRISGVLPDSLTDRGRQLSRRAPGSMVSLGAKSVSEAGRQPGPRSLSAGIQSWRASRRPCVQ